MCRCKEVPGAPIWGATCKCSHAEIFMINERFINDTLERAWICKQPNCDKAWVTKINFGSQDQLEGRV